MVLSSIHQPPGDLDVVYAVTGGDRASLGYEPDGMVGMLS